ncbi:Fe(3+)-hydroxamate ABC transporter permease FhuB [Gallibacterium trehalosifermentans]|uniref:Fe(3+)-hydroxamate ABC transporter permease FhuB n=1 Tax=Gallibacterium trehalosifermentans TaxID=516935 RepID=A0ABV6GYQ4_9PAST
MVARKLVVWNSSLLLIALLLIWGLFALQLPQENSAIEANSLAWLLIQNYTLPRMTIAILAGVALGLASLLLQQIVNNPLASDSTLGVGSGAQLLLFIATLFVPNLLTWGTTIIAFLGALLALVTVFLLAWRQTLSPLLLILAGLVVNLYFGAISATLMLFYPEESRGLMIWGAGSLVQESWQDSWQLFGLLLPAILLLAILQRPLAILGLNESNAKSLGVSVQKVRVFGLLLAAYLVAIVVSRVGMLGFIGFIAAALSRQLGVRSFKMQMLQTAYLAAMLLLITDLILQLLLEYYQLNLPTGAVTSLLGTPLLLWLMFRHLPQGRYLQTSQTHAVVRLSQRYYTWLILFALLLVLILALMVGRSDQGWQINWQQSLLTLRYPRMSYAFVAGVLLALAGVLLQRISFNAMASPELLGITSGVSFGVLVVIFLFAQANIVDFWIAGVIGALIVLLLLIGLNHHSGMLAERILLTGMSLTALFDAVQRIILASGDFRLQQLLSWTSGSTYYAENSLAILLLLMSGIAVIGALSIAKWLDLLGLQAVMAQSLGLNLNYVRWWLILFSAGLTAIATLMIGPLSFIGLLAPHFAKFLGFYHARSQLISSALLGGIVMTLADWLGRQILFPYEIPAGLMATLLGGSYFLFLVRKL